MEQRHYLALARQHGESELAKKITEANRFYVRLTNMVETLVAASRKTSAAPNATFNKNTVLSEHRAQRN